MSRPFDRYWARRETMPIQLTQEEIDAIRHLLGMHGRAPYAVSNPPQTPADFVFFGALKALRPRT